MENLRQRVLDFIRREGLLSPATGGSHIVLVGVSGGPDSVCLLHILSQLKESLGVQLHIVHLNHMLRGASSDGDARSVEAFGLSMGIPVTIEACDVDAYRKEHKLSLEEAAREVRYDFFARTVESVGAMCVALGHTEDDQVETVLMHLVRGSGLAGLRGMLPVSHIGQIGRAKLRVLRPLLEVSRKEIEDYCLAYDLKPRTDLTNYSLDYTRNRFRHELVPMLREANSNVGAAIRRVTRTSADDLSFIESEVAKVWSDAVCVTPLGITINTASALALHPALQRHLLRRVMREALGDLVDIEAVHIEGMMEALRKPAGRRISLPRGLTFYISYDTCLLAKDAADVCPFPAIGKVHHLMVPGVTLLPGWRVQSDVVTPGEQVGGFNACIDMDASGAELTVRRRRPGDRFQPLGMNGTKRLQDFMVDVKIPGTWRDRVPLVCSPDGIVWVAGWRISERVRVTGSTRRMLRISFELR
jgi:tRNA(Ile)-lysidine synthase